MVRYIPETKAPTNIVRRSYTGDGSTTNFTVTAGSKVNDVYVDINGIMQLPTTNYTISGTTLTFDEAPANGYSIHIIEYPI